MALEKVKKEDFPKCPICGANMHVAKGRFGTFLACDNYKEKGCKGRADDPNREYYKELKKQRQVATNSEDKEVK